MRGVVRILLERDGVDSNTPNEPSRTPLSQTAVNLDERVVSLLLYQNGATPTQIPLTTPAEHRSGLLRGMDTSSLPSCCWTGRISFPGVPQAWCQQSAPAPSRLGYLIPLSRGPTGFGIQG